MGYYKSHLDELWQHFVCIHELWKQLLQVDRLLARYEPASHDGERLDVDPQNSKRKQLQMYVQTQFFFTDDPFTNKITTK